MTDKTEKMKWADEGDQYLFRLVARKHNTRFSIGEEKAGGFVLRVDGRTSGNYQTVPECKIAAEVFADAIGGAA